MSYKQSSSPYWYEYGMDYIYNNGNRNDQSVNTTKINTNVTLSDSDGNNVITGDGNQLSANKTVYNITVLPPTNEPEHGEYPPIETSTGKAPDISTWNDDDNLSLHFVMPEQAEDYNVDVYVTRNDTGEVYDLDSDGQLIASVGHKANFFGISGDGIHAGMLWGGEGAVYNDFLDIAGAEGLFTIHVEVIGDTSGDVLHNVATLVSL